MTKLAEIADVEKRLKEVDRHLATDDATYTEGLIESAAAKVVAHLGVHEDFYEDNPVPSAVTLVTSESVARVLRQDKANVTPGTSQHGQTTGPFSQQTTFVAGAGSGSPWLTRADKDTLDNVYGANKAFGVDRLATASVHDISCSLNFGANYCSCGASIAGQPIYGLAP